MISGKAIQLAWFVAIANGIAALLTAFLPGVLNGPAFTNGNARHGPRHARHRDAAAHRLGDDCPAGDLPRHGGQPRGVGLPALQRRAAALRG
jgi:hypothetical protein